MIVHATIASFDAVTYIAVVTVDNSLNLLRGVPVSRAISSGLLTAGTRVALALLNPANPTTDAIIIAVF